MMLYLCQWIGESAPASRGVDKCFLTSRQQVVCLGPGLRDSLSIGPLHVNSDLQRSMRRTYFGDEMDDSVALHWYKERLNDEKSEVFFLGRRRLVDVLACLWFVTQLGNHPSHLPHLGIVVSAADTQLDPSGDGDCVVGTEVFMLDRPEIVDSVRAVWRWAATDPTRQFPMLPELPESIGKWMTIASSLCDYAPDRRGIDLLDQFLLHVLTRDWIPLSVACTGVADQCAGLRYFPNSFVWDRILGLSRYGDYYGQLVPHEVFDIRFTGCPQWSTIEVRLTDGGLRLKNGRRGKLWYTRPRWVGGRVFGDPELQELLDGMTI